MFAVPTIGASAPGPVSSVPLVAPAQPLAYVAAAVVSLSWLLVPVLAPAVVCWVSSSLA